MSDIPNYDELQQLFQGVFGAFDSETHYLFNFSSLEILLAEGKGYLFRLLGGI